MTKLVPRTELLQWLDKSHVLHMTDELCLIWQRLSTGKALSLEEWTYASEKYYQARGENGPGDRDTSEQEVSSDFPETGHDTSSVRPVGDALQSEAKLLVSPGAQVDSGEGPQNPSSSDATRPVVGSLLGAYRLETSTGHIIFAAVQGEREPQIFCGVGLGLPQALSDYDVMRVLEFGKVINWENIKEIINA